MKIYLRNFIFIFLSILMVLSLIIGIGIVDNSNKIALGERFLNTIYIDLDNYILCFRYLGFSFSFSFNISDIINNVFSSAKPLIIIFLIVFAKIKNAISNLIF